MYPVQSTAVQSTTVQSTAALILALVLWTVGYISDKIEPEKHTASTNGKQQAYLTM